MAIKKQPSIFTQIVKIIFLGLFFVSIYTAFRIKEGYTIAKSMSNIFEGWPINTEANRYTDIKNKNMTNDFISNVIINQIYNEDIKDDLSPYPGIHYLKYFNYFMGMRITYNRAELQQSSTTGLSGKPSYRISNYNGNPNIRFSNIIADPFGRNKTEYQENEGYKNTGGYVFYFDSNLTYEKADEKYREIVEDGLFNEYCLSIVLEILIYNCNYQTGVIISYEFLVNNAGNVFKDKNIDAFYMSRYSTSYAGYSQFLKYILIFIDATFGLYYVIICILLVKKLRKRFYDLCKLKHNSFIFVDYLEMCNCVLIFICFVFWVLVFCFPPAIKLPTNGIADFEKYRLLADRTTYFSYITSLSTIPILFRCFIYISVSYPSFRGLFDTVIIALKDLALIFVSLLIAMLGFIYASEVLFNCYIPSYTNFFQSLSYMIYRFYENPDLHDISGRVPYEKLYHYFQLIFILCFGFIMVKQFVSVIIVRYLYLRSIIHFENEVKASIINKHNQRLNKIYLSMLMCKKYREKREENNNNDQRQEQISVFNLFKNIVDNFNFNLNFIREINAIKPKEQILKEEAEMRHILINKK